MQCTLNSHQSEKICFSAVNRIIESVDLALQLSNTYDVCVVELGQVFVLFFFSIIVGLFDSVLDDWGLLQKTSLDRPSLVFSKTDSKEHHEEMRTLNSFMAMEVLGKLTESRKAVFLLRLVRFNL